MASTLAALATSAACVLQTPPSCSMIARDARASALAVRLRSAPRLASEVECEQRPAEREHGAGDDLRPVATQKDRVGALIIEADAPGLEAGVVIMEDGDRDRRATDHQQKPSEPPAATVGDGDDDDGRRTQANEPVAVRRPRIPAVDGRCGCHGLDGLVLPRSNLDRPVVDELRADQARGGAERDDRGHPRRGDHPRSPRHAGLEQPPGGAERRPGGAGHCQHHRPGDLSRGQPPAGRYSDQLAEDRADVVANPSQRARPIVGPGRGLALRAPSSGCRTGRGAPASAPQIPHESPMSDAWPLL